MCHVYGKQHLTQIPHRRENTDTLASIKQYKSTDMGYYITWQSRIEPQTAFYRYAILRKGKPFMR